MRRRLPRDPLTCARLARHLIGALVDAPGYPLVLGARADLATTAALVDELLARALRDEEGESATKLVARWASEAARLGLRATQRGASRRPSRG